MRQGVFLQTDMMLTIAGEYSPSAVAVVSKLIYVYKKLITKNGLQEKELNSI